MKGIFYGVGVGPGDPELITIKALRIMQQADVIALPRSGEGDILAWDIALKACCELAQKPLIEVSMPMTRDKDELTAKRREAARVIEKTLDEGRSVAFLTLGDPTIYSTAAYLLDIVKNDGYETLIVPGVPSFCAASALLGEALVTDRQLLKILPASCENLKEEVASSGTRVIMKSGKLMQSVKEILSDDSLSVTAVVNCGMAGERILRDAGELDSSYFSLVIVKDSQTGQDIRKNSDEAKRGMKS